ncbi:ABC transporter permease [Acidomonas methanolica]|uniref:ABC transporter n=1 Tax=Acidomonas methanolica NBRC 104435 TaxID=1231351 RepID=A0A023D282_ACIMT|nr:iron export ABC transporter permease subunit FetB [Acidomonas methanolica]TCS25127.1 putative ABC transport system permease protein [Acidomonas methanolica]GAJ27885.1 hypothetical protein Amme_009_022 [Acidomonas methanolica NBRC 104435]GBQ46058.1 hypothetical protein AA0498_0197 [Acidomonas methanolica]GEK99784.1 iron export ABC transporter permease subunit FetB [Acidomonas methanolica NBRC 104435]
MTTPSLMTNGALIVAAVLVGCGVGLSVWASLGVARNLLTSAVRMAIQLLLVGNVLLFVFTRSSVWLTVLVVACMFAAAAYEAGARQTIRLPTVWHFAIGTMATFTGTTVAVLTGLLTVLHPHPWYQARSAIPMVGLLLGNVMNATSLSMNALLSDVSRDRRAVEARISLGASRFGAMRGVMRQAIRTALLPTFNQMAAAGIITLPGIMTGQVLAGMNPIDAARYQIVLMSLIVSGNMIGATVAASLLTLRLTDARGRLRLDRLKSV